MKRIAHKAIIFFFIGFLSSVQLSAQSSKLKKADEMYEHFAYMEAIELYEELIIEGENSDHITKRLADCYRLVDNIEQAEYWYSLVVEMPDAEPITYYHYAQALKSNEKYEQSALWLSKYAEIETMDSRAQRQLAERKNLINLMTDSSNIIVRNLPVNSENADFGPMYYGSQMLFVSSREDETKPVKRFYGWDKMPFLDLFVADVSASGDLVNVKPFSDDLNTNYHEGPATFNSNRNLIYFTRNNYTSRSGGQSRDLTNNLKIYKAIKIGDIWSGVEGLPFNSDEYSCGHPTLSPGGDRLYFSSDMPGGYGGVDIYYCQREAGSWSEPQNMGEMINTEGDEMFPFFHRDSILYFSSDGLPGLGGLDVLYTLYNGEEFEKPVNFGSPVNSPKDDFSFIINEDMMSGYFASSRDGGKGDDDIYYFKMKKPQTPVSLEETLVVEETPEAADTTTTPEEVDLIDVPIEDITLDDLEVGKIIRLENIYYDLDKSNIRPDAAVELDKVVDFMKKYPTVKIELSSHTDCRASDEYNMTLSHKRAVSATMYIVERGINASRITAQGYGEHQLTNECADGVPCTEEQHQDNRRTEIKVLDF